MVVEDKKTSPILISFLQALGAALYCGLVALFFWRGESWFGETTGFWGPVLILVLFVTSALISALLVLGYPIILFWEKKKTSEAIRLVAYTTGWLVLFVLVIIAFLAFF
jgi:hypothetical protein